MKSCIYVGDVSHYREQPHRHGFNYSLFMMYLDLDELPGLFKPFLLWSATHPALAWFRRQDHMGDPAVSLKQSVQALIFSETGKRHNGPVRLLTHLRYMGHCMNPVSFYYCWDETDNRLEYIVAEVHNTPWKETHCYVLNCQGADMDEGAFRFCFDKKFHVSPFMDMCQQYQWCLSTPGYQLRVDMDSFEDELKMFNAGMCLERKPINQFSLARVLVDFPLMTMKVVTAIYWQALKLWIRKTPFYSHPENIEQELKQ
jgi:DUF1365 family protein